jgi:hypothetical protein
MTQDILIRTGAGEVDKDMPHGYFYLCAGLEEFQPDASRSGIKTP